MGSGDPPGLPCLAFDLLDQSDNFKQSLHLANGHRHAPGFNRLADMSSTEDTMKIRRPA